MKFIKKKYNLTKKKLYSAISKRPILISSIVIMFFIVFFYFSFQEWQKDELPNLANELIGALIILIIVEAFILKISNRSLYPKTKAYIFSNIRSILVNLSYDILHNYLKIHSKELKEINIALVPGKDYIKQGAKLLQHYCTEELRYLVEEKYVKLSDEHAYIWAQNIQEYRFNLRNFLTNASLIKPKDEDFASIYIINKRLFEIELELKKTKEVREKNKKFFSSYIFHLSKEIIKTMESGLYSHFIIPEDIKSVMARSQ